MEEISINDEFENKSNTHLFGQQFELRRDEMELAKKKLQLEREKEIFSKDNLHLMEHGVSLEQLEKAREKLEMHLKTLEIPNLFSYMDINNWLIFTNLTPEQDEFQQIFLEKNILHDKCLALQRKEYSIKRFCRMYHIYNVSYCIEESRGEQFSAIDEPLNESKSLSNIELFNLLNIRGYSFPQNLEYYLEIQKCFLKRDKILLEKKKIFLERWKLILERSITQIALKVYVKCGLSFERLELKRDLNLSELEELSIQHVPSFFDIFSKFKGNCSFSFILNVLLLLFVQSYFFRWF
jgi:hypothetical protein